MTRISFRLLHSGFYFVRGEGARLFITGRLLSAGNLYFTFYGNAYKRTVTLPPRSNVFSQSTYNFHRSTHASRYILALLRCTRIATPWIIPTHRYIVRRITIVGIKKEKHAPSCAKFLFMNARVSEPFWCISSMIESIRWIVCGGQRERIMENRRVSSAAPTSSRERNVVSELSEISRPRLCRRNSRNRVSTFPRSDSLRAPSSRRVASSAFFPPHTSEFLNLRSANATSVESRNAQGKMQRKKKPSSR